MAPAHVAISVPVPVTAAVVVTANAAPAPRSAATPGEGIPVPAVPLVSTPLTITTIPVSAIAPVMPVPVSVPVSVPVPITVTVTVPVPIVPVRTTARLLFTLLDGPAGHIAIDVLQFTATLEIGRPITITIPIPIGSGPPVVYAGNRQALFLCFLLGSKIGLSFLLAFLDLGLFPSLLFVSIQMGRRARSAPGTFLLTSYFRFVPITTSTISASTPLSGSV